MTKLTTAFSWFNRNRFNKQRIFLLYTHNFKYSSKYSDLLTKTISETHRLTQPVLKTTGINDGYHDFVETVSEKQILDDDFLKADLIYYQEDGKQSPVVISGHHLNETDQGVRLWHSMIDIKTKIDRGDNLIIPLLSLQEGIIIKRLFESVEYKVGLEFANDFEVILIGIVNNNDFAKKTVEKESLKNKKIIKKYADFFIDVKHFKLRLSILLNIINSYYPKEYSQYSANIDTILAPETNYQIETKMKVIEGIESIKNEKYS